MDKYDIPFEILDLKNEMPILTSNTAWIPTIPYEQFPKDFLSVASKVDNRYLNNHVSILEEIAFRFPNNPLPKWLKNYHNRYFTSNLAHDNFFKADFSEFMNIGKSGKMTVHRIRQIINTSVPVLESGDTSSNTGTLTGGVWAQRAKPDGTVGDKYNQIAINIQTAAGNYRVAAYADSSGSPSGLYSSTGSIAATSTYTYQSVTEYTLTAAPVWLAFQVDSNSCIIYYKSGDTSGYQKEQDQAYGAFPNPIVPTLSSTNTRNMKTNHT